MGLAPAPERGRTLYQLARQRAFAPHDFDCGNRLDLQQKHGVIGECECGKVAAVDYINSLRCAPRTQYIDG